MKGMQSAKIDFWYANIKSISSKNCGINNMKYEKLYCTYTYDEDVPPSYNILRYIEEINE